MKKTAYISGPMRGYKDLNFPAFDKMKKKAMKKGFAVISPADQDRMDFGALDKLPDHMRQEIYFIRDMEAIRRCSHVIMLKGWRNSKGARGEFFAADWLGKTILNEDLKPIRKVKVVYE